MSNVAAVALSFIFQVAAFFFLARFVLQLARADFYNPISQTVVKLTDPLLRPLRLLLRPIGRFDASSFGMAWALHCLQLWGLTTLQGGTIAIGQMLGIGLLETLLLLVQIFFWGIIIVAIASWFVQGGYHPALALVQQIIEPVVAPIRKIMPDLGGLDLSPMVAIFLLLILQESLRVLFYNLLT